MTYSVVSKSDPVGVTDEKGAGVFFRIPALFDKMRKAGWIRPVVDKPKMVLFRLSHCERCLDRLERGEFPE